MTKQFDFWVDDKTFIDNKSAHLITRFFAETAEYMSKNYIFESLLHKFTLLYHWLTVTKLTKIARTHSFNVY